jgi:hypothetical protein
MALLFFQKTIFTPLYGLNFRDATKMTECEIKADDLPT